MEFRPVFISSHLIRLLCPIVGGEKFIIMVINTKRSQWRAKFGEMFVRIRIKIKRDNEMKLGMGVIERFAANLEALWGFSANHRTVGWAFEASNLKLHFITRLWAANWWKTFLSVWTERGVCGLVERACECWSYRKLRFKAAIACGGLWATNFYPNFDWFCRREAFEAENEILFGRSFLGELNFFSRPDCRWRAAIMKVASYSLLFTFSISYKSAYSFELR